MANGLFQRSLHVPAVPGVPAAQIKLVRLDVIRMTLAKRLVLRRGQFEFQLIDNVSRDLVLDLKNVLEVSIVAFRPDLITIVGVDELSANAHSLIHSAHASLEDGLHIQELSDFRNAE